ncbi:site-specific DNA-methyltransferase (adenine-specific) [Kroppenstedtia eburnea]|uniref:Methyltransferase n=2 Tax=Kroppenstedtia eburnea TaxID=714067 RepID=A0A1N7JFU8_9BACL|nr:site-specific DNA-methyltransferase [Kroppenstedtia eburnea]SIS48252.1 site-specific DNA-methyltransferase (adenine-specific) [Kroppenstedtia eburnea]
MEQMKKLPSEILDAVITDPPYCSGSRQESGKGQRNRMTTTKSSRWFGGDGLSTQGFLWFMRQCALEWNRLLKPGGHVLVFIDWRMMTYLAAAIESADFRYNSLLVWDKTYFTMGACFRNQHELILHFSKGKGVPQRRDVGNVLSQKPVRNGQHPTEKPVDLIERLLSVVCPKHGLVLDSFAGSGTTGVACLRSGRHYVLIERDPYYAEVARGRLQREEEMKHSQEEGVRKS